MNLPAGSVSISPAYLQALGVRTDKVTYHDFGKAVHSFGRRYYPYGYIDLVQWLAGYAAA